MKNRSKRLITIKKIISSQRIGSQEELLSRLKEEGFEYTQATLSRDLKFLKVARIPDGELGYLYRISGSSETQSEETQRATRADYLSNGFRSINFSANLSVIKTLPGYASSIAAMIDESDPFELIGTIAGDDNILLVMREGVSRTDLINALILIFPGLEDKLK